MQSSPVLAMEVGVGLRRAVFFLKKGEPIQYRRTGTHAHGFFPHTHAHTHGDGDHTHSHGDCGSCEGGDCKKETIALLTYMLQHNEHHAAELDQMADNLQKMGLDNSAKTIKEAVADFQKGNMRLGLALTLVKEEMK